MLFFTIVVKCWPSPCNVEHYSSKSSLSARVPANFIYLLWPFVTRISNTCCLSCFLLLFPSKYCKIFLADWKLDIWSEITEWLTMKVIIKQRNLLRKYFSWNKWYCARCKLILHYLEHLDLDHPEWCWDSSVRANTTGNMFSFFLPVGPTQIFYTSDQKYF